jgi:hypothetical protein
MVREWLVYVAIMLAVLVVFLRDQPLIGIVAGLLVSGPLYLGLGYVLAKLGYQRKSWREVRSESARPGRAATVDAPPGPRPKPPPTRRTGGGSGRTGDNPRR